jgi:hypothetical protein
METMKVAVLMLAILAVAIGPVQALTNDVPFYEYTASNQLVYNNTYSQQIGLSGTCPDNSNCNAGNYYWNSCGYTAYLNGYAQDNGTGVLVANQLDSGIGTIIWGYVVTQCDVAGGHWWYSTPMC